MARSQPVATAVTATIAACVVGVIVSTTGQTVAIERDVLSRIDEAGVRTIIVEDTSGAAGIPPAAVERINALTGIDWAVGFGIASDVRVAGLEGGTAVPIRGLYGSLPPMVTMTPWDVTAGTALAGVAALDALGLATAAGTVQPVARGSLPLGVVGWLDAEPPLDFLDRGLLTAPKPDEIVVRIIVLVDAAEGVPGLIPAIRAVLDPRDSEAVVIRSSDDLVAVREAVRGELGTWGRNLVTLVLGAGLVLTALNMLGVVATRRRDFGRRRALGASRLDIMALVTIQTVATAAVGAMVGAVVGALVVLETLGVPSPPEFNLAVAILAVIATAVAAAPPALLAAYRDPVRILRVA